MTCNPFPAHGAIALLALSLALGGCTWQRTVDDARQVGRTVGALPAWEIARTSSWRLPAGARVMIVVDPVCAGNDCAAAAGLGQAAALNQLLGERLLAHMNAPWPRTLLHPEPIDLDAGLALATVRGADFLIHVQAREVTRDRAFRRGRSQLRLQLVSTNSGAVVDTARIDARVDLLGLEDDMQALLENPLDDYVAMLVGR